MFDRQTDNFMCLLEGTRCWGWGVIELHQGNWKCQRGILGLDCDVTIALRNIFLKNTIGEDLKEVQS